MKTILLIFVFCAAANASCDSIAASGYGGWKPAASAPRDGSVVEMLETYGVAPWYGIFKWTTDRIARDSKGNIIHLTSPASWVSVDNLGSGVGEDACLFWRPYKAPTSGQYSDPTGGAQKSVAYWCAYMHVAYDPKTGYCKK